MTDTVNTYFALLLITIAGAAGSFMIIRAAFVNPQALVSGLDGTSVPALSSARAHSSGVTR